MRFRLGGEVSEHQWQDVREIVRIQGDLLDRAYLYQMAEELGVTELLERLFAES